MTRDPDGNTAQLSHFDLKVIVTVGSKEPQTHVCETEIQSLRLWHRLLHKLYEGGYLLAQETVAADHKAVTFSHPLRGAVTMWRNFPNVTPEEPAPQEELWTQQPDPETDPTTCM